ncbi:MAG: PQQ-binding-like beta-propeller repeat protein [Phycisphaeraceae bacterium]
MRLMTLQWFAVVALLAISTGCASGEKKPERQSVNYFQDTTKPIGMLIEPTPASEIGYRLGWASPVQLLEGQAITSVTALGDMVIVVEDPKNIITALSANDGELLWKINLGSDIESIFAPSRDEDQVFIHSASRFFTLKARTGDVTAVAPLAAPVSSKAVYAPEQRLAIMSGTNGLVFAHSVNSNFSRWSYRLANRITSSAVLAGQDVFVVDSGGTYAMLETSSGTPLWRNRTLGKVSTNPAVQGSEVIVASEDGKLYAMNRTTGRDTWKYLDAEQKLTASPVALGRLIIQPLVPNEGIIAIDAINGSELWRTEITATPLLTRQRDMLLYTDNKIISIDLDDGSVNTEVLTQTVMTVLPIGDDGGILLVSPNGRLLKLSPQ